MTVIGVGMRDEDGFHALAVHGVPRIKGQTERRHDEGRAIVQSAAQLLPISSTVLSFPIGIEAFRM
jgi:hypothetical protein